MKNKDDLKRIISKIEGRGYKAYKDLTGSYTFDSFDLIVDHVQSDPFASPSRFRALISHDRAGFSEGPLKP